MKKKKSLFSSRWKELPLKFYIPENNYAEEKKADLGLKQLAPFSI